MEQISLQPIGIVRSSLMSLDDCPLQGNEGAPEAWIELLPGFETGIKDLTVGKELILLTWFHAADRSVLQCYPRKEENAPPLGVFSTRSPDRPNPIGLHPVTVLAVEARRLKVHPLEALNGTPVIDIKPVI